MNDFDKLHVSILKEIKKNGSCVEGYEKVHRAMTIAEISRIIKLYWNEVLDMHLHSSLLLFSDFFGDFQEEFNENGIYFNQDASEGYALIYNGKVRLDGDVKARAFGESEVEACGKSSLIAYGQTKVSACNESCVELREQSSAAMQDQCEVKALDATAVVCRGGRVLTMCNQAKAEVYSCGSVHAYGNSMVNNKNPRMERRIYVHEDSITL